MMNLATGFIDRIIQCNFYFCLLFLNFFFFFLFLNSTGSDFGPLGIVVVIG